MHFESIAVRFSLALTVLLWTGVLCAKSPVKSGSSLNAETVPLPKMSSLWLDLNDDLLSCICQFYGPVRFNASDRQNIGKVLKVLTALSRLFENLKYVGTIEVDEVLAYYMLLSELSFVKKKYPDGLEDMLRELPLPKGNLTLSLLISTGNINQYTFYWLASYIPYISDKSARLDAVNYCLDACAEGSLWFYYSLECILIRTFEPGLVSKLKRILRPYALSSDRFNVAIYGWLLHFADAELGEALVDDLSKALAVAANTEMFAQFWLKFICYPTTLRDFASMQAIFERNVKEFQAIIPFTSEQRIILSVINKIKFGAVQDIKDMSEAERKALFRMFSETGKFALVFHIWAREDVPANVWEQFDNDPSNDCILSRLAFGLERLFQDYFDVDLVNDNDLDFGFFLNQFKDYPSSSKKQRFQELLRAKVQEHSEVVLALFWNYLSFGRLDLVDFFIDQDDKEGLKALINLIFREIDSAPLTKLVWNHDSIVTACLRLGGGGDGPLRHLAERVGAATVLCRLDLTQLRANDLGGMLRTLGVSWEQMDAALSSLSHQAEPEDELAAVLTEFQDSYLDDSTEGLPSYYALWFYLWKEHPEAFVEHMHPKIKQHYLPEESKLHEPVR